MKKVVLMITALLVAGSVYAGEVISIATNDMGIAFTGFEIQSVLVDSVSKDREVNLKAVLAVPEYTNTVTGVTLRSKYILLAKVVVTATEIEAANSGTNILDLQYGTIDTTVRALGLSKITAKLGLTP
jgi:hypothetical protein